MGENCQVMGMKRGISVFEILVVVAILMLLGALLFPVFGRAKMESKATAAKSNLRGMWQGLLLYQQDYEERVQYGPVSEMGLPAAGKGYSNFLKSYTGIQSGNWVDMRVFCPCGIQVNDEPIVGIFYFGSGIDDWPRDVKKFEGNTVVLADKNCNASGVNIMCQYCDKRSI